VAAAVHPIASARPSGMVRVSGVGLQWWWRTWLSEPVAPTASYSAARQGPTSLLTGWASRSGRESRAQWAVGPIGGEINPTQWADWLQYF
jgi:hypothetical protein